ncbi:DUF1903-domain-containing protein [Ascodesmis nigricans]|uniref:Cx9C motif-containing protein 4, mitochondrial n=1 Tax=Ascodesmis nigricans TaxID=341454 RepID=A0A4S2N5G9_9PEZI|nr:DUF1903-domain-containing protein [Ascodesmis nigricans]
MAPVSLEKALQSDPPCFPRACAIQSCLRRNQYNEARCTEVIDALYDCCAAMYQREGLAEKNVCCPKRPLLELKMKQRAQERGFGDAEVYRPGQRAGM